MFNHQIVQSQVEEVNRLMKEKRFPINDRSTSEMLVLLISELIESAQEYKRHGMDANKEMAEEMVDTFIRAANYWYDLEWEMRDTNKLNQFYSFWVDEYPKSKWTWYIELIAIPMKISTITDPKAISAQLLDLMAGCRTFCEIGCGEDFDALYREVMDKNWQRPVRYNTAEEEK